MVYEHLAQLQEGEWLPNETRSIRGREVLAYEKKTASKSVSLGELFTNQNHFIIDFKIPEDDRYPYHFRSYNEPSRISSQIKTRFQPRKSEPVAANTYFQNTASNSNTSGQSSLKRASLLPAKVWNKEVKKEDFVDLCKLEENRSPMTSSKKSFHDIIDVDVNPTQNVRTGVQTRSQKHQDAQNNFLERNIPNVSNSKMAKKSATPCLKLRPDGVEDIDDSENIDDQQRMASSSSKIDQFQKRKNSQNSNSDEEQGEESSSILPVGLKNLGNTCYINSVLQSIFRLSHVGEWYHEKRGECKL